MHPIININLEEKYMIINFKKVVENLLVWNLVVKNFCAGEGSEDSLANVHEAMDMSCNFTNVQVRIFHGISKQKIIVLINLS